MRERTDYDDKKLGYTKCLVVGRDTIAGAKVDRIIKRGSKEGEKGSREEIEKNEKEEK